MTVTINAALMEGAINVRAACSPATSRFKVEHGDGILSQSQELLFPNGATSLTYAIDLPANSADYRVRVSAFDDADTQQWVESDTWSFETTNDSKFGGGGKTLKQDQ